MSESATDQVKDAVKENATSDDDAKLIAPLKKAAVAAAVAALTPVIKEAVTNAAEKAVKKGPEMLAGAGGAKGVAELAKGKLGELGGDAGGGAGGLVKGALGAVTGGGDGGGEGESGGDAPPGYGSGRRMPVQQAVDVAAPIDIVYNQFTQFEDYPRFMHRVESVEQRDDGHVVFRSKQWKINRSWEAEITDQRPDERIAWRSTSGVKLSGVATFHKLGPRLTRIEVNVDFDPEGFFEKVGRGMRFAKRSIRADLHRFKAYVEMQEQEDGSWRGYVVEGEAVEEEEYFDEEPGDEPEGAAEDEAAGEEDEDLAAEEPPAEEERAEEEEIVSEEPLDEEEAPDEEELEEDLEYRPIDEEELEEEGDLEEEPEPEPAASRSGRGGRPRGARDGGAPGTGRRSRSSDGAGKSGSGRSRGSGDGARAATRSRAGSSSGRGKSARKSQGGRRSGGRAKAGSRSEDG